MAGGIFLEREIIQSQAYFALNGVAPQLLAAFLDKRKLSRVKKNGRATWVCENCDGISFTYVEAEKRYGISKPRFTRGRDDLLDKGFIEIVHPGGGCQRDKAVYKISDRWRLWRPGVSFNDRTIDVVRRGYQGRKKK